MHWRCLLQLHKLRHCSLRKFTTVWLGGASSTGMVGVAIMLNVILPRRSATEWVNQWWKAWESIKLKKHSKGSKASAGLHRIVNQFDKVTHVHKVSQHHSTRSAKDDELMMLDDLHQLQPFRNNPGRFHNSFQDIKISPLLSLNFSELFLWIDDHKKKIGYGQKQQQKAPTWDLN